MHTKSITIAAFTALLTALTLGGSIWGFLFLGGPNSVTRLDVIRSDNTVVNLMAIFMPFLCGGGLWGLGLARLMNADARSMMKACALTWTATVVAFGAVIFFLASFFGGLSRINFLPIFLHSRHYNFLLVFVPIIGIASAINAYVVTRKLGFGDKRKFMGMYTGLAAALGFLTVGLILLFGLGWEVGRPVYGKYGMLLLLLICSIGAALAGGASLGWMLSKARESRMENMNA